MTNEHAAIAPLRVLRPAVAALRGRAKASPRALALRFKRHGRWHGMSWAQFERLVDDTAGLWRGLGLGEGARIRIVGAWSEAALATCYAAASIGAEVVAASSRASASEGTADDALLLESRLDLEGLTTVHGAAPRPIVVRNGAGVEAGDRPGLHLFDSLLAAAAIPAAAPLRAAGGRPAATVAVGAETPAHASIDELLDAWTAQGLVLAFPEPQGDRYRDLRELAPDVLFDGADAHAALADHLRSRWPNETSPTGRLLAATLRGRHDGWLTGLSSGLLTRWLRLRVRRQLGLGRLLSAYTDRAVEPDDAAALAAIGLRLESYPANVAAAVPQAASAAVVPARSSNDSAMRTGLRGVAS